VSSSRHPQGLPGSLPLVDKRDRYLRLMAQGITNAEACRLVGVGRGTGVRWRYGRTVTDVQGRVRAYAPISASVTISPRFLSQDERMLIADLRAAGRGIRSIATELARSPSTISREIRRNSDGAGRGYQPFRAHQRAAARRLRPKAGKLAEHEELRTFVQDCLRTRWSPEQISSVLPQIFPDHPEMRVCHETIYQALYRPDHLLRRAAPTRALRSGRLRRRRRRRGDQRTTNFIEAGNPLSQRPAEAEDRTVAGHWEGDLITGKHNKSAIGTLIERTTRYTLLLHLPDGHNGEQVRDALVRAFATVPADLARSLTWDQGGEMSRHHEFTSSTGIPVYFCEPSSPWQRGSNENTNGLLRQYFPKGSDLSTFTANDLIDVAEELNCRPRKCLGWKNPTDHLTSLTQ